MVNSKYVKGRRFEYKIVNLLKKEGWIAFRSAGSHSPIDIVAIHTDKKIVQLIQCKAYGKKLSIRQEEKIMQEAGIKGGVYFTAFRVITPECDDDHIIGRVAGKNTSD